MKKKNKLFPMNSITSKVLITCIADSLILILIILYILSGTFLDLETDLTEDKLASELNYFSDALTNYGSGPWRVSKDSLYCGNVSISDDDPDVAALLAKIEESTGSACGVMVKTQSGRYLTAAMSPMIPRSYDIVQLLTSDYILDRLEKTGGYVGTSEYGGIRVCCVYRMIYTPSGSPAGCIFTAKSMTDLKEHAAVKVRQILILILIAVAVSVAALIVIAFRWTRSADAITDYMKKIEDGERPDEGIELPKGSALTEVAEGITDMVGTLRKKESMDAELGIASQIQEKMLPGEGSLPEMNELAVRAVMVPAREVGGDFYDYFMLDENRIAVVIADVSGKGMPAALVMAIAKTFIKNCMLTGITLKEAFATVNRMLCEGNSMNYFVTAWAGILDTSTGELTYVNAGHNPPFIIRRDGRCEKLSVTPCFVLGGLDSVKYVQKDDRMEPGDRLFLYTDGVTEADSPNGMFGTDRLTAFLEANADRNAEELLDMLKEELKEFRADKDQSDDITALVLDCTGKKEQDPGERIFPADETLLPEVNAFVEEILEKAGCSPALTMKMMICLEEIFINISRYGYPAGGGTVKLLARVDDGVFTMRFEDSGIPFDPISKEDPDVNAPLSEREPGGLGIFMVKKYTDSAEYEYRNGKNILTLKKTL